MATGKDLNVSEIPALDKQIETLMECKPLAENEVKALCERVSQILVQCFLPGSKQEAKSLPYRLKRS